MNTRFFDYNATTPLCPEAKAAWLRATDELWLNPSSPYRAAARVKVHLDQAREQLAAVFGVESARIAFNSGATEGNNAVFAHWAATLPEGSKVGVSPTEHPSVIEAAKYYFGDRILWLALDANGAVDAAAIPFDQLAALSVMAANNETGVLNPWQAIATASMQAGVVYHCDASQWVGKLPTDGLKECNFVTLCGHKFGGPRGVGAWILPQSAMRNFASLRGGEQESAHRAGTEDVAAILAMVAALISVGPTTLGGQESDLNPAKAGTPTCSAKGRDALIAALPEFELVAAGADRLWNTAMLIMPEFASVRWIRALEKRGFLISAGSACSTGKEGPSHVLAAMGYEDAPMRRSLRISAGPDAQMEDWLDLAAAIRAVYMELKAEADDSDSHVISI